MWIILLLTVLYTKKYTWLYVWWNMYDLFVCGTNVDNWKLKYNRVINYVVLAVLNVYFSGVLFRLVPGLIRLGQSRFEVHVLILDQEGLLGRFLEVKIKSAWNFVALLHHSPCAFNNQIIILKLLHCVVWSRSGTCCIQFSIQTTSCRTKPIPSLTAKLW